MGHLQQRAGEEGQLNGPKENKKQCGPHDMEPPDKHHDQRNQASGGEHVHCNGHACIMHHLDNATMIAVAGKWCGVSTKREIAQQFDLLAVICVYL